MQIRSLLAASTLLLAGLVARADTVTSYTSLSAFQAASTTTVSDFSGGTLTGVTTSNPFTNGPFTYSFSSGSFALSDGMSSYSNATQPSFATYLRGTGFGSETITFSPTTAVGFFIGIGNAPSISVTVDGMTFSYTTPGSGAESFIGFTSSGAFSSLTISPGAPVFDVVEGFYGTANTTLSPIPEPSSIALLGSGLLGLAGFARKRFA